MSGGLAPDKQWLRKWWRRPSTAYPSGPHDFDESSAVRRSARWPTRAQVENSHCTRVIDGTAVAVNSEPAIPVDSRPPDERIAAIGASTTRAVLASSA